ncbi:MAG: glycogen/starch synthase [Ignavibacteriae bacterium]|nr:glycogen/starch synthase [Ignavibacteria bacterium]MBI3364827.1 glycogen/starch synthase [Ignavibacteriota bacterium]
MSRPIDILFVASEAGPFIKSGSIGELAGTLPKIVKTMGHDIRVMLPGYGFINNRRFQIHNLLRMKDIAIPIGNSTERANIKSSYLNSENQKVLVYFLANERYFSREGLYFHPETKKYFPDNDERFIFFCRGVLETLKRLHWQPQIIHCIDWQSGLIPAYLSSIYKNDPYFRNVKTVFTVCSLASHASFPKDSYEKSGLPSGMLGTNGLYSEKLNFLRAGLAYADLVTTFGTKAEKGIRIAPQDDLAGVLEQRHSSIVSMNNGMQNENHQELLARKFVDIYRDLVKNG